ncbi:MAG: hypothetical protein ACOX7U_06225 [Desulfitobacteriia bacterium]
MLNTCAGDQLSFLNTLLPKCIDGFNCLKFSFYHPSAGGEMTAETSQRGGFILIVADL